MAVLLGALVTTPWPWPDEVLYGTEQALPYVWKGQTKHTQPESHELYERVTAHFDSHGEEIEAWAYLPKQATSTSPGSKQEQPKKEEEDLEDEAEGEEAQKRKEKKKADAALAKKAAAEERQVMAAELVKISARKGHNCVIMAHGMVRGWALAGVAGGQGGREGGQVSQDLTEHVPQLHGGACARAWRE